MIFTQLGRCDVCRKPSLVRHTGKRWACAFCWGTLFGEAML